MVQMVLTAHPPMCKFIRRKMQATSLLEFHQTIMRAPSAFMNGLKYGLIH